MVYVVLRNGKVLQYNGGAAIAVENGAIAVRVSDHGGLIARIPFDIVERAEFEMPCRIRRAKGMPRKADY
jgi:hypothetical protein